MPMYVLRRWGLVMTVAASLAAAAPQAPAVAPTAAAPDMIGRIFRRVLAPLPAGAALVRRR